MYSIEHVFLILEYHKLEHSPAATRHSFQTQFNVLKRLDVKTIHKLFNKFQQTVNMTGDLVRNVGPKKNVAIPASVTTVPKIIQQISGKFVWRIAAETGLKCSSTQKILNLHMFPFKIQNHYAIPKHAVWQRADFVNQILTVIDNKQFDLGWIWFTDEAHFHQNRFKSKQNWQFWGALKIPIGVKQNHCIQVSQSHCMGCSIHYRHYQPFFKQKKKKSLVMLCCNFGTNCCCTVYVGRSTRHQVVHAR